jgi:uncharacterized protein involved in cysteine biosynthesis
MIGGLVKAIAQLGDPAFRRVLWKALAVAVLMFLLLWGGAAYGLSWAGNALADWAAQEGFWNNALEWLISLGGLAAVLVASFLLFPAIMGLAQSFFLEDAADAVEARHYPDLPPAGEQPILEGVWDGLRLAAVTIVVNIIALPLYLLPLMNVIVFYLVNGYLLGREYFEVVAVRRLTPDAVRSLRGQYGGRMILAGIVIAVMLTIPLVNLLAPVVATAYMVHVVEGTRRRSGLPAVRADACGGPARDTKERK